MDIIFVTLMIAIIKIIIVRYFGHYIVIALIKRAVNWLAVNLKM
jgi:hypothetical protein